MIVGKDGVAVKLRPGGGVTAVVTELRRSVARATRTAFAGVARAARLGRGRWRDRRRGIRRGRGDPCGA
jgi:hypothetical protein